MADKLHSTSSSSSPQPPPPPPPNNFTELEGHNRNATFKQSTRNNNSDAKASHLVNVVISFLDDSKTVFQISVSYSYRKKKYFKFF